jgi:hypothetical protein
MIFILAGNAVNQDSALAEMHETSGAANVSHLAMLNVSIVT